MGQVIYLNPSSAAFPAAVNALEKAEAAFLQALRFWVAAYRLGEDPLPRLCETMDSLGAHDAAFSIDRLMAVIARLVRQPIAIHCEHCPHLSHDERHLLHAVGLVQVGESGLAERALRTALLSAGGADFALGPLEGFAELFADAKLFFRKRPIAATPYSPDDLDWAFESDALGPSN
jgi:hypothetical protein